MTCSSSTTCNPEAARGRWRRRALALAALTLAAAAPVAGEGPDGAALVDRAAAAIRRGDGIDAEMSLRAALERGVPARGVNALMGEAMLAQGDRPAARDWLGKGAFTPATAPAGWRALGLLERLDGNLPASGRAYDKALALTPDDAGLWVEIGRLRYAGGEHVLAIAAAQKALSLQPDSVRALEFGGELVRDRYGPLAAVPWFERAIMADAKDVPVLLQYAATLGELGRASESLTVTRRVLELKPKNPRAYYLQAVLAARAGDYPLARRLLARTRGKLDGEAGAQMLRGVTELAAGNALAASEALEAVLRADPENRAARDLLARAIQATRQYRYLTLRFAEDIARDAASPYVLTTVARGYEMLGDRRRAGDLLDRAARVAAAPLRVLPGQGRVGALLGQGQGAAALAAAEGMRRDDPGFYDAQALAGDALLALGRAAEAQERYAAAARVRSPQGLFERRFAAYTLAGDAPGARALVEGTLRQDPANRAALRAAARLAFGSGDLARARAVLRWLRDNGDARDLRLLTDLSVLDAQLGDPQAARESAAAAYRLQRASPLGAQALAWSDAALSGRHAEAVALLDKAQRLVGTTPLIARTREELRARRES